MKRALIILVLAALSLSAVTACNGNTPKSTAVKKKSKYTCTMHPDLSFDKPGTCSKCGMELVERDTTTGK
jgi:ABC-type oligopeptide transport system substrate-binding subunit